MTVDRVCPNAAAMNVCLDLGMDRRKYDDGTRLE